MCRRDRLSWYLGRDPLNFEACSLLELAELEHEVVERIFDKAKNDAHIVTTRVPAINNKLIVKVEAEAIIS